MIRIERLSKSFEDKKALRNVSFHVKEGEILGIVGHNGAGKSTLINCMVKIHKEDEGHINYSFNTDSFYENIGVQMQQSHFEDKSKVIDLCNLYNDLTYKKCDVSKLLKEFELYNERNNFNSYYDLWTFICNL